MNKADIVSFIERVKKENRGGYLLKSYSGKDFSTGENGTISGYFATFDHDHGDSYGDVIRNGAFAGTIERRKKTGHPFPMCFNHDFSVIIGKVTDIGEDEKGAYFTAEFFPTDKAQEIRSIVKSGVLWQFSFAYDTLDAKQITAGDGSKVNELRDLELYEISIVLVPANPRATITDIKGNKRRVKRELLKEIARIEKEQKPQKNGSLQEIGKETRIKILEQREKQIQNDIMETAANADFYLMKQLENEQVSIRHKLKLLKNRK